MSNMNNGSVAKRVLYIRLPVWKIYPGGMVYLAHYLHQQRPRIEQELLDLALVEKRERRRVVAERVRKFQPDLIAFSWRNMQTFGPHPENDALDVVMNFDHSRSLWKRLKAAWDAIFIIWEYLESRLNNFGFMKLARRIAPDATILVGGTAVSIFAEHVIKRCPSNSYVVVGEGEDALVSIADGGHHPLGEYFHKDHHGKVEHRVESLEFALEKLTAVDFHYIQSIFPGFEQYLEGDFIGVQTKRGCPYHCNFCIYNEIEGHRQRYRNPVEVAREIESLSRDFGVEKIWFTDAQFISTRRSAHQAEAILDELLARKVKISWAGYLRFNYVTPALAEKMFESGLSSVDLTFTGSQHVIDQMSLGYKLEQQMEGFRMLRDGGHIKEPIKLYMPLNAPGESVETLCQTLDRIDELYKMFGRDFVLPFIFFVGVQPNTPVEELLISQGYLNRGYNPLTLNPFTIKKLLYNPPPLGSMIGRAYLKALEEVGKSDEFDYIGRAAMDNLRGMLSEVQQQGAC